MSGAIVDLSPVKVSYLQLAARVHYRPMIATDHYQIRNSDFKWKVTFTAIATRKKTDGRAIGGNTMLFKALLLIKVSFRIEISFLM